MLAGCCAEPSERRRLEELASRQGRLEGGGGEWGWQVLQSQAENHGV